MRKPTRLGGHRPLAPQREEERDGDGSEEDPDGTERGDAAEDAEEAEQERHADGAPQEPRANDVVDHADRDHTPRQQEPGGRQSAVEQEPDARGDVDERRAGGREREERGEGAEEHGRAKAGRPVAEHREEALRQRGEERAVHDRADGLAERLEHHGESLAAEPLERALDLRNEDRAVAVQEEEREQRQDRVERVPADVAGRGRDRRGPAAGVGEDPSLERRRIRERAHEPVGEPRTEPGELPERREQPRRHGQGREPEVRERPAGLVAEIVPGITVASVPAALGAGLVLGLINAVVRPILVVLTLPVTLLTLGLFLFVLNAFCLWFTSLLVKGFEVHGFWAAMFGSLLVSILSWTLSAFVSDRGRIVVITRVGRSAPPPRPLSLP